MNSSIHQSEHHGTVKLWSMPKILSKIFIPLPTQVVYQNAKDVTALEPFLSNVDKITPIEITPNRTTHKFEAKAAGKKIMWTEVEEWDDINLTNKFHSPQGDFDKYQGNYIFKTVDGGTEMSLELEYEINIPLIGGILKGLIAKLMQESCDSLLKGLKDLSLSKENSR